MTFTKAGGLGKQMVDNLFEVQQRYREMLIADRKAQGRGGYIIGWHLISSYLTVRGVMPRFFMDAVYKTKGTPKL